jgi:predicted permease
LPRLNEISLDLRVLGWALAITVLAGILVGLSPAIATLRRDLRPSGAEGGRSVSGGVGIRRIRRALVVADFALAIILLGGAGLLIRSWWNVNSISPGFRSERVLVMELSAPMAFSIPAKLSFYHRLLETLRAIPDVEDAGIIGELFKDNNREEVVTVERDDGTVSERLQFAGEEVSADFFKAIGTPLLRGRFFSIGDGPDAPPVAIINDAMARRSWPGHDPLGKRFKLGPRDSGNPWYTVVGVVADMRAQGPEREPFPQMFVPLAQSGPPRNVDLFVRTSSDDPQAMAGTLRAAVRGVEKNASIAEVATLEQQFGTYFAQRRFQTSLLIGFSIVALLMAAVGIYGLIQYSIATRTQEIGIRMAVGADAAEIFRMILGEGMKLTLTGLMFGLLGALWLGQAGSGLLFGVTPTDPLTFIVVSLLLIAVAVAACCFPARRAMKIEPIVALRQE